MLFIRRWYLEIRIYFKSLKLREAYYGHAQEMVSTYMLLFLGADSRIFSHLYQFWWDCAKSNRTILQHINFHVICLVLWTQGPAPPRQGPVTDGPPTPPHPCLPQTSFPISLHPSQPTLFPQLSERDVLYYPGCLKSLISSDPPATTSKKPL